MSQSYTISGIVVNAQTQVALQRATLFLASNSDSTNTRNSITDSAGNFSFSGLQPDSYKLVISSVGFGTLSRTITVDTSDVMLDTLTLRTSDNIVGGVTVTATVPLATQKGDTVQFNASQFKVQPDASAEDLARKMPGITVENGQVKANGENVQKVTIDGRELFGDDATAALRNLPAEIIDKIQVFDRLSDQAQLSGVEDANTAKRNKYRYKSKHAKRQFWKSVRRLWNR